MKVLGKRTEDVGEMDRGEKVSGWRVSSRRLDAAGSLHSYLAQWGGDHTVPDCACRDGSWCDSWVLPLPCYHRHHGCRERTGQAASEGSERGDHQVSKKSREGM